MAAIVEANNAYGTVEELTDILGEYGLSAPSDLDAMAVRASRMIDRLPFKSDDEATIPPTTLYRWPYTQPPLQPGQSNDVPERIAHAVALIAVKLGDPTKAPPQLPRRPQAVRAGSVAVEFPNSTDDVKPQMSDSEILARRLGIPDPRAVDLLRPWLKLPADLLQDDRPPGTSIDVELYVQGQNIPPRDLRS